MGYAEVEDKIREGKELSKEETRKIERKVIAQMEANGYDMSRYKIRR